MFQATRVSLDPAAVGEEEEEEEEGEEEEEEEEEPPVRSARRIPNVYGTLRP